MTILTTPFHFEPKNREILNISCYIPNLQEFAFRGLSLWSNILEISSRLPAYYFCKYRVIGHTRSMCMYSMYGKINTQSMDAIKVRQSTYTKQSMYTKQSTYTKHYQPPSSSATICNYSHYPYTQNYLSSQTQSSVQSTLNIGC